MTDKRSNYEPGDELLSAYLDGELSAAERAAVEARLATDPAAQQLLHELRSVSQSVQALPTETTGRDLSEEIIRRARQAKPAHVATAIDHSSTADDRSRSGDTMPKIRIFSSKRAWIWASMALAAGLLLMIIQSGDEPEKNLPPVAARNKEGAQFEPAGEAGQPARRERAISAVPQSQSAPPATVAFDGELRDKVEALGTANKPAGTMPEDKSVLEAVEAPSTATASPEQVAPDKRYDTPQPTGGISATSGALGVASKKQKAESNLNPNPPRFVVVRIITRPDALQNGSFERVLADHKIEFVPQPAKNDSLSFGGGKLAKPAQNKSASQEQSKKVAATHASPTEMVLVEAPAPAIESCLADLNKNSNDFLSIAVNEEAQPQDRIDVKVKSTLTKKLAEKSTNLSRFSRGALPKDQKDTVRLHDYYEFNKPTAAGSPRAGGLGGEASTISGAERDKSGDATWHYKDQSVPEIRRARRIESRGIETHQAGEPASAGGPPAPLQARPQQLKESISQRMPTGNAEAKADTNTNDLKVLFVFTSADAAASSAPSDNRQK